MSPPDQKKADQVIQEACQKTLEEIESDPEYHLRQAGIDSAILTPAEKEWLMNIARHILSQEGSNAEGSHS